MKNFKISHVIYLLILTIMIGLVLDICSEKIGLETVLLQTINPETHKVDTKEIIDHPTSYKICKLISNILYILAISVFISVFVSTRIEAAQREKQAEEIKALQDAVNINVFDSLFKTIIPKDIYEVIKDSIITNKVVRRNADWMYDFKDLDNGIIELRQMLKYELHNISKEEVIDPISPRYQAVVGSDYKLESILCMAEGKTIVSYDPDNPELCKSAKIIEKEGVKQIEFKLSIPPFKYVDVTIVFRNTYKDHVQDSYVTQLPIINARLTVSFPENFEFCLFQNLSTKLECTFKGTSRCVYNLKGAILPYQGFEYTLRKKKEMVEQSDISLSE